MKYPFLLVLTFLWLAIPSLNAITTPKSILPLGDPTESDYIDASLMTPETAYRRSGNVGSGFRFYDPSLQRWINQDPMGELADLNLYRFNYNDPMNFVDPNGLWGIDIIIPLPGGFKIDLDPSYGDPTLYFDEEAYAALEMGSMRLSTDGFLSIALILFLIDTIHVTLICVAAD